MQDYHAIAQESLASQDKTELEELLKIVGEIEPKNILEIGVHLGHSMKVWNSAFDPDYILGLERDTCYDYSHLPVTCRVFKGVSSHSEETLDEVIDDLPTDHIDFLFIDGGHLYEEVKKDFELYSPLVKKGGIIAFHDARITDNDTVEVYKFWNEIKEQYKHKEIFSETGTGVGVLWL